MASIFKPARVRQFVRMEGASSEEIVNAIDEVLVWSNLFGHHMSVDDVLRNMQVRCTGVELQQIIEQTSYLSTEENIMFSAKHSRNPTFKYSQKLAEKHLDETKDVLSILNSCKQITGLAVTGSVAAGMNEENGDVDVLIITKPGWVWRTRALAVYLSHKHPGGQLLCPNMVMSENSLVFEKNVYVAREMMQIIPLKDDNGISQLYTMNTWVKEVLPNTQMKPSISLPAKKEYPWWWRVMNIPILGSVIESWEARRRIKELKSASQSEEAVYSKSICRGHENAHKSRIEAEYTTALEAM
jgi:predicted nucleotidyltransferase